MTTINTVLLIAMVTSCRYQSADPTSEHPSEPKPEKRERGPQPAFSQWYVGSAAFSPDGKLLVTSYYLNGLVVPNDLPRFKVWDVATGNELRSFRNSRVTFAFLPDSRTMLWSSPDIPLTLWDLIDGRKIRTFSAEYGEEALRANCITVSADGKLALTGGGQEEGSLNLWDVSSGQLLRTFQWRDGMVVRVGLSPDKKWAISACRPTAGFDDDAKLWDVASGKLIKRFPRGEGWSGLGDFSPDSRLFTLGLYDKAKEKHYLVLWDLGSGKETHRFPAAWHMTFMPDGKRLLTGKEDDGMLRLWDLVTGKQVRSVQLNTPYVPLTSLALSSDGTLAFSAVGGDQVDSAKGNVLTSGMVLQLWDVANGRLLRTLAETVPVQGSN
jgi:WD40 repeat protein